MKTKLYYCPKCKRKKDISSFHKANLRKDERQVYCKVCIKKVGEKYQKENVSKIRQYQKEWRNKYRDLVFQNYGGARCYCCGEKEIGFLTLDHINGG